MQTRIATLSGANIKYSTISVDKPVEESGDRRFVSRKSEDLKILLDFRAIQQLTEIQAKF
jgi:hypothetical protein